MKPLLKYQASTQSNIKLKNQEIIFQLLLDEGSMTRADLAKKMNSSKPTISKNVEALLKDHKIIEVGKDDNLVGKKGTLIDINSDYAYVLALDLSKNQFRAVIANLKEKWLFTSHTPLDKYLSEGNDLEVDVLEFLKEFIKNSGVSLDKIAQVILSYSGVVGHNDELYLTNLKYKETLLNQLKPFIKDELKKPLIIKNDINLAAMAEKKYGKYASVENLYLFSADIGVGVGMILHNRLYEGDRNAAGEVGFVLPVQHKDGRYYTIEERVSLHALANRYRKIKGLENNFEDLVRAVTDKEADALMIYEDVLEDLSVTMTNIASILDIKTVVVTGRLFDLSDTMIQDLNERIDRMTPFNTTVSKTTLDQMSLRGAVALSVGRVIETLVD